MGKLRKKSPRFLTGPARKLASNAAEAIAGAIFGLIAFALGQEVLGGLIGFFGISQSIGRFIYSRMLEEELEHVHSLAVVVDLRHAMKARLFQEMMQNYLRITEIELQKARQVITDEAHEKLRRLAEDHTADLERGEFYNWLLPMMRDAPKGAHVWAVSMMLPDEWEDSAVERTFLEHTLAAAKRGVYVERVFIIAREQIQILSDNERVQAQIKNQSEYLRPMIAERSELATKYPALLEGLGDGMIAFDNRVVLIDASAARATRGRVTMKPEEIARWRGLFESLVNHSRPLTPAELDRWRTRR